MSSRQGKHVASKKVVGLYAGVNFFAYLSRLSEKLKKTKTDILIEAVCQYGDKNGIKASEEAMNNK